MTEKAAAKPSGPEQKDALLGGTPRASDGMTKRSHPGSEALVKMDFSPEEEANLRRLFLCFSSVVVADDAVDSEKSAPLTSERMLNFDELRSLLLCQGLKVTDEAFDALKDELELKIPGEIALDEFFKLNARSEVLRRLRSEADVQSRKHIQTFVRHRFHADTIWRWTWDSVVLFVTLYYAIIVSFEWVGNTDELPYVGLSVWETVFSLFLIADMVVYANTVKQSENGQGIESFRDAVIHYFKRTFIVDFIGTLPLDLVLMWVYPATYTTVVSWRVFRALRLVRIFRVVFTLYSRVTITGFLQPSYVYLRYTVGPVLKALFYFIVFVHLLTVSWLAVVQATNAEATASAYKSTGQWNYINSLYVVLYTLFTIGYGDMVILGTAQRLYMCGLFVAGTLINGLVISQMSAFVQKANVQNNRHDKMRETLAALKHFQIPNNIQAEILSFQQHLLWHNMGSTHEELISALPETIQESLGLFARIKFIALVPMFANSPRECQEALATRLKNQIFHPRELIIIAGEVGNEMYFLGHGVADVIAVDGRHLVTLRQGAFFGEMAMLVEGAARTASIKALTYCDTFRLGREDFTRILQNFPHFRASIEAEIAERIIKYRETARMATKPRTTVYHTSDAADETQHDSPSQQPQSAHSPLGASRMIVDNFLSENATFETSINLLGDRSGYRSLVAPERGRAWAEDSPLNAKRSQRAAASKRTSARHSFSATVPGADATDDVGAVLDSLFARVQRLERPERADLNMRSSSPAAEARPTNVGRLPRDSSHPVLHIPGIIDETSDDEVKASPTIEGSPQLDARGLMREHHASQPVPTSRSSSTRSSTVPVFENTRIGED